jgi:hypothetical protein
MTTEENGITPMPTEKEANDAPTHFTAAESGAWAEGYNSLVDETRSLWAYPRMFRGVTNALIVMTERALEAEGKIDAALVVMDTPEYYEAKPHKAATEIEWVRVALTTTNPK